MKRSILTSILVISAFTLQAQDPNVGYVADSIITPQFFIAVIAGVLLAMGFQFILTALSVALGITAIGDLKEKYVHSKNHPDGKKHFNDEPEDNDSGGMSTGSMVTTGFGVWSTITVGLSLFGATALAINLSLIASTVISITLGLVVWATFFILMFYLESRVVNTLIGGLINTATAGLRASGEAVKNMVTPSREHQLKNVAEDTVEKIRKDFQSAFDPQVIDDTIDEFFTRMDKSVPDYEEVKNDIREIVEETSRQEKSQGGGGGSNKWMAVSQVMSNAISQSEGGGEKGKVEQLKTLQKELKQAYSEGETEEEKMEKVVAKLTPAEEEQVHSYIQKIKQLISQATPEDMERGNLKNQVMQVVENPKENAGRIWSKISEMDRESIVQLLANNTALKKAQIEEYADKIQDMINSIKAEFSGSEAGFSGDGEMSELQKKVQMEVNRFMGNTGKADLDMATLTNLFQGKLDDQKENLKNLKTRLQNMDKDSLTAMVTNNTRIDQKDIDKVVQSIEDAKNNVLDKINKIEDEANRRIENMKRKAVIEAEATRKNAAAAAWWVVGSAVISAGAAIGGSLVAMG